METPLQDKKMDSPPDVWNPNLYLSFANDRTRPAIDLLSRIKMENPKSIVDLGCGAGNVTAFLRKRWKDASIEAIDNSPAMLGQAKSNYLDKNINWKLENITDWSLQKKDGGFDIVFSNAALHWVSVHKDLFPQLMNRVNPGGILAVQMPNNSSAPSHKLMMQTIAEGPWASALSSIVKSTTVAWPAAYKGWLHPHVKKVEVWETQYIQHFEGDDPVFKWISATALAPVLSTLKGIMLQSFIEVYSRRLREAYPRDENGRTAYKMRRTFIIAEKN